MKPKSYYFDTLKFSEFNFSPKKRYGFLAQDLEQVLPELVSSVTKHADYDTLGNIVHPAVTFKAINYIEFIAILANGIQELDTTLTKSKQEQKKITDSLLVNSAKQDSTINSQNSKIDNLQTKIATFSKLDSISQVQSSKIAELQNQISNCCSNIIGKSFIDNNVSPATIGSNSDGSAINGTSVTSPVLYQNIPNPFNQSTSIQYAIPTTASTASIMVFDLTGKLIKTIPITIFGNAAITINGNELSAGMFVYSLIVDGKIIDTKRMILTQ